MIWLIAVFALAGAIGSYSGRLWQPNWSYKDYFSAHFRNGFDATDAIWGLVASGFGGLLIFLRGTSEAWYFIPFAIGAVSATRSDHKSLEIHEISIFLIGITGSILLVNNSCYIIDNMVGLVIPIIFLVSQIVGMVQNKIDQISVGDVLLMIVFVPFLNQYSIVYFIVLIGLGLTVERFLRGTSLIPLAPILCGSVCIVSLFSSVSV